MWKLGRRPSVCWKLCGRFQRCWAGLVTATVPGLSIFFSSYLNFHDVCGLSRFVSVDLSCSLERHPFSLVSAQYIRFSSWPLVDYSKLYFRPGIFFYFLLYFSPFPLFLFLLYFNILWGTFMVIYLFIGPYFFLCF